jgi:hypothetical protein
MKKLYLRGSYNVKDTRLLARTEVTSSCITIFQVVCCATYYTGVFLGWITQFHAPSFIRNKLIIRVPFTEALFRGLTVCYMPCKTYLGNSFRKFPPLLRTLLAKHLPPSG